MINDFFNLIFPRLCCSCNQTLLKHENTVCTNCIVTLPKTNFHLDKENPVNKVFWGRVQIEMAASYYFFSKESRVQNLLHQLKYKGAKEVGSTVGKLYGYDLREAPLFKGLDFIVPVPLHENKLKNRGYNQSEWIAKGLSESMKIPLKLDVLYRKVDSNTQTKKSRYKRWENVGDIFGVFDVDLNDRKVLLVDDVLTTGATIEACAQVLIEKGCKIYVITLAYA